MRSLLNKHMAVILQVKEHKKERREKAYVL